MESNEVEHMEQASLGIKHRYLDQLESDFQLLSEIVMAQMGFVTQLIENGGTEEMVLQLKKNEKIIDSLDITIKEKVINAIMLFTPRAGDLRRLMAFHDMTIAIERVGDLIMNIVESLEKVDLLMDGFEEFAKTIRKMFDRTNSMLQNAIFAFSGINNEMAYTTILMDDKVDKLDRKIEKNLAEAFAGEVASHQTLLNVIHLGIISYYIERIGDKAVDMAEAGIYVMEGKDVRHAKMHKKELRELSNLEELNPES